MLLMKCCAFNCCLPPQGSAPAHTFQSEERALGALICKQHKVSCRECTDVPDHPPAVCSPVPLILTAVRLKNGATAGSSRCARV